MAETLVNEDRLDNLPWSIDFEHKWVIPREGRGGGLALFWKSSVNLTIKDSSKYYIDPYIDKNTKNAWCFTEFYGELEICRQVEVRDILRRLNHHSDFPWMCAKDFNEIFKQEEKLGGALRNHHQLQLFRDVVL